MQNLPALFLLFGRNNIITFLTGISYQETRFLHKLIGLIVWIETIIHTFGQMGYYLGTSRFLFFSSISFPFLVVS